LAYYGLGYIAFLQGKYKEGTLKYQQGFSVNPSPGASNDWGMAPQASPHFLRRDFNMLESLHID
jgi:hypothetical protein